MIQEIAPHLYDNAYKPKAPDKDSIALYYEAVSYTHLTLPTIA